MFMNIIFMVDRCLDFEKSLRINTICIFETITAFIFQKRCQCRLAEDSLSGWFIFVYLCV